MHVTQFEDFELRHSDVCSDSDTLYMKPLSCLATLESVYMTLLTHSTQPVADLAIWEPKGNRGMGPCKKVLLVTSSPPNKTINSLTIALTYFHEQYELCKIRMYHIVHSHGRSVIYYLGF